MTSLSSRNALTPVHSVSVNGSNSVSVQKRSHNSSNNTRVIFKGIAKLFPDADELDLLLFDALARVQAAAVPNSLQRAAMNDCIVRNELKTLVREVYGYQWTVKQKMIDCLNMPRMATNLPILLARANRHKFEAAALRHGYDPSSEWKILEAAIIYGCWTGMQPCPHHELNQFFEYTRSEHFQSTRMSLRPTANFLSILGAFVL